MFSVSEEYPIENERVDERSTMNRLTTTTASVQYWQEKRVQGLRVAPASFTEMGGASRDTRSLRGFENPLRTLPCPAFRAKVVASPASSK